MFISLNQRFDELFEALNHEFLVLGIPSNENSGNFKIFIDLQQFFLKRDNFTIGAVVTHDNFYPVIGQGKIYNIEFKTCYRSRIRKNNVTTIE